MKIRPALSLLLLLSPVLGDEPVGGYAKLEELLPGDASVVVLVEDVTALQAKWDATPMAKTWADASVQKFFAPAVRAFEKGSPAGDETKELRDLLQGPAAAYLSGDLAWLESPVRPPPPAPMPVPEKGDGEPQPPAIAESVVEIDAQPRLPHGVLVCGVKDPEAWTKLFARLAGMNGCVETAEEFEGVTLQVSKQGVRALVGRTAVMGFPKSEVQKAVSVLKKGVQTSPLSAHPTFRKVRACCPRSDVLVYANLEPWAALAQKKIGEAAPMMGADPEALTKALGLDALKGAFLGAVLEPASTGVDAGLLCSENRGIVRLLAVQEGAAPKAAFLPPDAVQLSSTRYSFPALVNGILDIAKAAGMGPMADMMIGQLDMQCGVDLRKDLIGNLGGELHTASVLDREEGKPVDLSASEELFALPLTDAKAFDAALDKALKGMARLPEGADPAEAFPTRDYLGNTIHVVRQPAPFQYAVTDAWILASTGQGRALEAALARMAKPGPSAWDRPEVKAALAALPDGASGLGYSDLGVLAEGWFEAFASAQGVMAFMGPGGLCDPAAKPDGKAVGRHWGPCVTGQYRSADGILVRSRLLHPK